jgi:hypothetical protein
LSRTSLGRRPEHKRRAESKSKNSGQGNRQATIWPTGMTQNSILNPT